MSSGIYKRILGINCGFMKGKLHSEETKLKISKNNARFWLGKKRPIETGLKISKAKIGRVSPMKGKHLWENRQHPMIGKKHSLETIEKISQSSKGRKWSLETREKMKKAHTGGIHSGKNNGMWKHGNFCEGVIWTDWHREKAREYYYKYPNKKLSVKKRTVLMRSAGELSIKTLQLVYEDNIKKFGTLTCYICLQPIEFKKDVLEHKIPLSRGGTNEYNNLEIACRRCNSKKHNKTLEEYKKMEV